MKKSTRLVLLVIVLAVALICFAGCNNNTVNIKDYREDNLNAVGQLVKWMYGLIGNYGWTVVIFTVALKLLMTPLDYWQRVSMRKSSLKMQKLQPQIDKINKQYGQNSQRANQEIQKLYSKQGVSTLASCLPMIITLVVFFVMFGGLNSYSKYNSVVTYRELDYQYFYAQNQKIAETSGYGHYAVQVSETQNDEDRQKLYDAVTEFSKDSSVTNELRIALKECGQQHVAEFYKNNHESWLWIQNVWQPDTWTTVMADYDTFKATVSLEGYYKSETETYDVIKEAVCSAGERGENGRWNGLMILPIMSIALSFLSIWINQRMENKKRDGSGVAETNGQQNATNKTMMIMMPLMMAFFGFKYTGAFAIYMVVNYMLSIVSSVALKGIVEHKAGKAIDEMEVKSNSGKANYMR